jgi:uncharacterized protein (TIGR03083 family)
MEIPEHIAALELEGERLAVAADAAGPDAKVPTCPDWVVRDLVRHQGGVHRWAASYVRDARMEYVDEELEDLVGGWPPDDELIAWFREGHRDLVEVLRTAPPDVQCFTFLDAPSPLAMWARRQAHETAIHRVDAESAQGVPFTRHDPTLASDGVDELLQRFVTRPKTRYRLDPARTIEVRATDTGAVWSVEVGPERIVTTSAPADSPDLAVSGAAPDLYLWLWNRVDTEALTVAGDQALLADWREQVQVRWS